MGLALVRAGGFRLFERVMGACIGVMFATVVVVAIVLWPGTGAVLRGLLLPTIPDLRGEGVVWTVAMMGGVGGTLTVLCYGYWIREEGRTQIRDLALCRLDLALGYAMTAIFAMAMVAAAASGQFLRLRMAAGLLLIPYVAWLIFAATLTSAIEKLNPSAANPLLS